MLLSDEEIESLANVSRDPSGGVWPHNFAKALQAAILAKLASAELPTTVWVDVPHFTYTADQLRQAYAQGAAAQLSAEPEYYVYRVNGLRWNSSAGKPHEDDYDEGTLVELYTRRQA